MTLKCPQIDLNHARRSQIIRPLLPTTRGNGDARAIDHAAQLAKLFSRDRDCCLDAHFIGDICLYEERLLLADAVCEGFTSLRAQISDGNSPTARANETRRRCAKT